MTEILRTLKADLLAAKAIDKTDVAKLKEALGDKADRESVDLLFDLKDRIRKTDDSFGLLFANSVAQVLLEDADTPGEIDEREAKWIRARISRKGYVDKTDEFMLANLRQKSINFPEILNFKSKHVKRFEILLFGIRFVTLLAVAGSVAASILLFITSTLKVVKGGLYFYENFGLHLDLHDLVKLFVEAVDGYLFAGILLIFGIGLYELFISKIDPVSLKLDSRPGWLKINSIDDLKSSLGKVILMILIVSFFEYSLKIKYDDALDLLFLGIGILLVSGALFLTHTGKKK